MAAKKIEEPVVVEETTGGKKKLILVIAGALLLVAATVGITVMLLTGDDKSAEPAAEVVVEEEEAPDRSDSTYVELKPFTVNLGPDDPVGFLQVEVHMLTLYPDVAKEMEKHKPMIRNNLTLLFGEQKSADLRSMEGKQALQMKVKESIQQVIDKYGSGGAIEDIFFANFVMQ